jgi:hypothetical protein
MSSIFLEQFRTVRKPDPNPAPDGEGVKNYDIAFLERLRTEADTTLNLNPDSDAARRHFDRIVEKYADHRPIEKSDLYALDKLVLAMASADEVRAKAPKLYQRYCEEIGQKVDPNHPLMRATEATQPADTESVRAQLQEILRMLHWSYTFGPLREAERARLIGYGMKFMAAVSVVLGLALWWTLKEFPERHFFAVLDVALYAGTIGGAVSCLRRVGGVSTKADALGSIYALENSRYVFWLAPLTGAVFAAVAMLLFMGRLLNEAIFPNFAWSGPNMPVSGWEFTKFLLPAAPKDYALLLIWCFISGFAEQLIPDTLSQLTSRVSAQEKSTAAS